MRYSCLREKSCFLLGITLFTVVMMLKAFHFNSVSIILRQERKFSASSSLSLSLSLSSSSTRMKFPFNTIYLRMSSTTSHLSKPVHSIHGSLERTIIQENLQNPTEIEMNGGSNNPISPISEKLLHHLFDHLSYRIRTYFPEDEERVKSITQRIIDRILSEPSLSCNNKILHETGKILEQSLSKSDPILLTNFLEGKVSLEEIVKEYKEHTKRAREMFKTIINQHYTVARQSWSNVTEDLSSLQQYSTAATAMGNRRWVKESNDWIVQFALSYFRHGNAYKQFYKLHNLKRKDPTHPYQNLTRDLMNPSEEKAIEARKIRLLDVGSCYNPLQKNENSSNFEITALDLYPADDSVDQCDFLNLIIGPPDSEPVIETITTTLPDGQTPTFKKIIQLPASSYDVISMSLVLSYLSNPQQREVMIRKARKLLRSSKETNLPHYNGLLLIVEKESIFTKVKQMNAETSNENQFYSEWKRAISAEGFDFTKYTILSSQSNRKSHAFAFSTKPLENFEEYYQQQQEYNSITFGSISRLWIRQDFLGAEREVVTEEIEKQDNSDIKVVNSSRAVRWKFFPIGIIGGGLGGAALALALQSKGIPFKLFEKDDSFDARRQGYALTMQQGGIALRELQIVDQVKEIGVISTGHYSYDAFGNLLGAYGYNVSQNVKPMLPELVQDYDVMASNDLKSRHNIHIPRQTLRNLLIQKVLPQNIFWNKRLQSIHSSDTVSKDQQLQPFNRNDNGETIVNDPHAMKLRFQDGSEEIVSIVVGADGVFSRVRQLLKESLNDNTKESANDLKPSLPLTNPSSSNDLKYLNLMVILGISNLKSSLDGIAYCQRQWLNGSTRVFTMPYDQDRLMWQLSYPLEEKEALRLSSVEKRNHSEILLSGRLLKEAALTRCAGWDPILLDIFHETDEFCVSGHPVYDRNPADFLISQSPWTPRITLLGDAAHPMSPFKGQGANQALLDALYLSKALISSEFVKLHRRKIPMALRDYERDMKTRTEIKVMKSREAALYLHSNAALVTGNITRAKAAEQAFHREA